MYYAITKRKMPTTKLTESCITIAHKTKATHHSDRRYILSIMTPSFGSHSPMAAFAGIAQRRPAQLIATFPAIRHGAVASRAVAGYRPSLASASTTSLGLNSIAFIGGMGGAASTVAANADALTAPALVTMFLLALQYCAQPPITRKFLDGRANKKGVTMVEEIVKIALSAFFFLSCGECGASFDVRMCARLRRWHRRGIATVSTRFSHNRSLQNPSRSSLFE
jgi:hypothetical protein